MTEINRTGKRWKRMGLTPDACSAYSLDGFKPDGMKGRYVDKVGPCTAANPAFSSEYGRKKDLDQLMMQLNSIYLQIDGVAQPANDVLEEMVSLGTDYLVGPWRDHAECEYGTLDRSECRAQLSWFDEYRMTLLAASILGDSGQLEQVSEYVRDDLFFDEGAWEYTREDNLAYQCLSEFLRTGALERNTDKVVRIEKCRRKRPKLILAGVIAIIESSSAGVKNTTKDLAKRFAELNLPVEGLMITSWDASILVNLARINRLEIDDLGLPLSDYIMTPKSFT